MAGLGFCSVGFWDGISSWLWKEWTGLANTCSFSESYVTRCKINWPLVACIALCNPGFMWVYHWDWSIFSVLTPSELWIWQTKNQSLECCNVTKEIDATWWGPWVKSYRLPWHFYDETTCLPICGWCLAVLLRSEGLTPQLLGVLLAASPQLSKGTVPATGLPCPIAPTFKLRHLQRLNLFSEFPVELAEAPTKIVLQLHLSLCPILLPSFLTRRLTHCPHANLHLRVWFLGNPTSDTSQNWKPHH